VLILAWLLACGGSGPAAAPTDDDADADGLSDADEARLGTDPANPDSDGDGKTDGVEVHKHKTDPTKMDTDGDGAPDGAELAGNTDPLVPNPEFMPDDPTPPAPDRLDGQPKEPTRNLSPDEALPKEWRCGPGAYEGCFVFVAEGKFAMGAQAKDPSARGHDPAAQPEEGPVHDVTVGPLWMMRLEFPAALWDRCVELRWCDAAEAAAGTSLFNAGMTRPGHPINGVTQTASMLTGSQISPPARVRRSASSKVTLLPTVGKIARSTESPARKSGTTNSSKATTSHCSASAVEPQPSRASTTKSLKSLERMTRSPALPIVCCTAMHSRAAPPSPPQPGACVTPLTVAVVVPAPGSLADAQKASLSSTQTSLTHKSPEVQTSKTSAQEPPRPTSMASPMVRV